MTAEMAEVLFRMKRARLKAVKLLGHRNNWDVSEESFLLEAEIKELKKIIKER